MKGVEGRRRRKRGRNKEEGGRKIQGRNKDFPMVLGVQGRSLGALEQCLGGPRWTSGVPRVLLGDPWGAVWEFMSSPQKIWGRLMGFGGARGTKTDDSEDLFYRRLAIFWDAISMYKGWT